MSWVRLLALPVVLLAAAPALAAEQDGELKAAQAELKLALDALQAAGRTYGEARNEALVHVKRAMREIRLGLLDAAVEREHGPQFSHGDEGR
jgi:hypothetical protein